MLRNILFSLLALCSASVSAAPFTYSWQTSVGVSSTGNFSPAVGQSLEVRVTLDNGGAADISQTWAFGDVVSLSYVINGVLLATFDPQGAGLVTNFVGNYQSNAAGDLTAVPSSFTGTLSTQASVTLGSETDDINNWFINGVGNIYASGSSNANILDSIDDSLGNVASTWQKYVPSVVVAALPQQVPLLPSFLVFVLGLTLAGIGSRAYHRRS